MNNFKVLCLMTVCRAGSKLFHSLLDNHPQVICFPRTLQFENFWRGVAHRKDEPEYIVDRFIELDPRFFDGRAWVIINKFDKADELGENRDETFQVDKAVYRRIALERIRKHEITRPHLFVALHTAYHLARGKQLPHNGLILYHIHGVYFEDQLAACLDDFPGRTSVVMMTRDPVKSMDSSVKWMDMQLILSCGGQLFFTREVLKDTQGLTKNFPGLDLRVVPFERLLQNHEDFMRALVAWLGLDWNDSLMASTIHGKLWLGNAKSAITGINPKFPSFTPTGFLETKDWKFFCTLFPDRMEIYGYLDPSDRDANTLGQVALWLAPLLPTAGEWEIVFATVNLGFWRRTYKELKEEIFNSFHDYADTRWERSRQLAHGTQKRSPSSIPSLYLRTFKQLILRMIWANPPVALYMMARRIYCSYGWIWQISRAKELPAKLLFESHSSQEREG